MVALVEEVMEGDVGGGLPRKSVPGRGRGQRRSRVWAEGMSGCWRTAGGQQGKDGVTEEHQALRDFGRSSEGGWPPLEGFGFSRKCDRCQY